LLVEVMLECRVTPERAYQMAQLNPAAGQQLTKFSRKPLESSRPSGRLFLLPKKGPAAKPVQKFDTEGSRCLQAPVQSHEACDAHRQRKSVWVNGSD
jgi:hypothetical protein